MLCSKCAEFLPDDARFCLQCGQAVDRTAVTAAPASKSPASKRTTQPARPRKPRSPIWVFLLLLLVAIWWAASSDNTVAQQFRDLASGAHTEAITEKSFVVGPRSFSSYKFTVPSGAVNVSVSGQFNATGSPENEVQVLVLSDDAFVTWHNGFAITPYYDSGKVGQGTIRAALPTGDGAYYLVFSNNFSAKATKAVQADVTLHYNTWWPEWVFHLKDKLWST